MLNWRRYDLTSQRTVLGFRPWTTRLPDGNATVRGVRNARDALAAHVRRALPPAAIAARLGGACRGGDTGEPKLAGRKHMAVIADAEIAQRLLDHAGWAYQDGSLVKKFELPGFMDVVRLVNDIAGPAEAADHHPDMFINYRRITFTLVDARRGRGDGEGLCAAGGDREGRGGVAPRRPPQSRRLSAGGSSPRVSPPCWRSRRWPPAACRWATSNPRGAGKGRRRST